MKYDDVNSILWYVWCFGVGGSALGLCFLMMEIHGPRFARSLAAILAAQFATLAIACWLTGSPAGAGLSEAALAVLLSFGWASHHLKLRKLAIPLFLPRGVWALMIVGCPVSVSCLAHRLNVPEELCVQRTPGDSAAAWDNRFRAENYLNEQIVDVTRRSQGKPLSAVEVGGAARPSLASVAVFDTGTSSTPHPLVHASAARTGWTRIPEDIIRSFDGDAVLANDRLAIVFRRGGSGAEVYGRGADRLVLRAVLTPLAEEVGGRLHAVALVENSADESALDATFRTSDGKDAVIRFEIQAGQPFVRTTVRRGVTHLRMESPCRFAVLPDFFGDDIVVDAEGLPCDRAALPSENFLMHMVGNGEAIVLAVWNRRDKELEVDLETRGRTRLIRASDISYGAEGAVFVAVLEGDGIWHRHEVEKADAGRTIRLDWKAPFPGQWRVDWRRNDGLTDSWQMFVEKPDGSYVKLDWFGQPEEDGTPEWLQSGRKRWTTRLGSFEYPCWIDKNGQGWFQPLADKADEFQGPALVYPIHRSAATPLAAFTIVDIVRATLGVGPCEYMLDVEGQKGKMLGVPTCVTRQLLLDIYAKKEQKKRRAEVERALDDVLLFVRHIRSRIETYAIFGRRMLAYLGEEEKAHPELAGFVQDMRAITRKIDAAFDNHRIGIHTPECATRLVEEFRATLLDYEGDDALFRCGTLTAAMTEIGSNQDELVGKCREAVKILRERAALAMAADPRNAPVAEEIRRLTHAMLRNPASFEAPRH